MRTMCLGMQPTAAVAIEMINFSPMSTCQWMFLKWQGTHNQEMCDSTGWSRSCPVLPRWRASILSSMVSRTASDIAFICSQPASLKTRTDLPFPPVLPKLFTPEVPLTALAKNSFWVSTLTVKKADNGRGENLQRRTLPASTEGHQ